MSGPWSALIQVRIRPVAAGFIVLEYLRPSIRGRMVQAQSLRAAIGNIRVGADPAHGPGRAKRFQTHQLHGVITGADPGGGDLGHGSFIF